MPSFLVRLARDESHAAAIEYGLIAGLIALAILVGAGAIGSEIGTLLDQLARSTVG